MAKKNIDPFIASLMPESDKKMGAIAGVSLVIALAMCIWASMYEQVVAEVVFDNADSVDLTTSMQIEQKEEKKEEKRSPNRRSLVRKLVAVVSRAVRVSRTLRRLAACSSSSLLRPRMPLLLLMI